jgi:hypothetical protein
MQVKDKQFLANVFNRISASVTKVNEKIVAHQQKKIPVDDLLATTALEQLAMQHEMLILLATMIFDPGTDTAPLPELPKKIIGFN